MKRLIPPLAVLAFAVPALGFGTGAQGCSGDCTACHKVSLSEVKEIFRNIDPKLEVREVAPAPARSLYQVTLKQEGETRIAYLDFSKNYLIAGQLIDIKNRRDLTREKVEEPEPIDTSTIPLQHAFVVGNPEGKKVLYLFSDPECPYCATLHATIKELIAEEPELKVYVILVPLEIHPDALWKTESIVCTAKTDPKGAFAMLEQSYEKKEVPRLGCAAGTGRELKEAGKRLGITMTPTLVFGNGRVLPGARSKEEIRKLLAP